MHTQSPTGTRVRAPTCRGTRAHSRACVGAHTRALSTCSRALVHTRTQEWIQARECLCARAAQRQAQAATVALRAFCPARRRLLELFEKRTACRTPQAQRGVCKQPLLPCSCLKCCSNCRKCLQIAAATCSAHSCCSNCCSRLQVPAEACCSHGCWYNCYRCLQAAAAG